MTRILLICFFACALSIQAQAASYSITQGDAAPIPAPTPSATAAHIFQRDWPVFHKNGKAYAWIAVNLHAKPGSHTLQWRVPQGKVPAPDTLEVVKGKFRISHITVKKSMSSFDAKALQRIRADQAAIKQAYQTPVNLKTEWPAMIWPVKGVISTPFAAQRYVNGKPRSPHSGLDIAAPLGTPVQAPLGAKVLLVADMFLNGKLIVLGHGHGIYSVYAHLNKAKVTEGDVLQTGDIFAEVGSSGRSTGPHLHWGVYFANTKINPLSMLKPSLIANATPEP